MNKLFFVDWANNYGLDCVIISAKDEGECREIIENNPIIWPGFVIQEIISSNISGIILDSANHS